MLGRKVCFLLAGCTSSLLLVAQQADVSMITTQQQVSALFAVTADEITERVDAALTKTQKQIDALCTVPAEKLAYATIADELDTLTSLSDMAILLNVCLLLENVTSDDAVRAAAHDSVRTIQSFMVDAIDNNKSLYRVFKTYADLVAPGEHLTDEQRYYLQETIVSWQRNGLNLPDEQLAHCTALKKEIAQLSQDFMSNIAQDTRTITVQEQELAGIAADFRAQLKRDVRGGYILGVDYPTRDAILNTCTIESTRKAFYCAFNNRAYPANQEVLERLIAARDELAHLLGMSSFNELCLADQMAEHPERAHAFLQDLMTASQPKLQKEFQALCAHLPPDVTLTSDGKLKPWDAAYIRNSYKKQHFDLDEELVAEYFPMQSTVDGLLHIYEQFFTLKFERIELPGLWCQGLTQLAVHDDTSKELLGYLILDLHPRANKYTHACEITIVPACVRPDGSLGPCVAVVLANLPAVSATKPALLKRNDVRTFFHEFGHALHDMLGRTRVAWFSGTHVKHDFMELPSQMLEEWLWDADILKMISKHYLDGSSLPDELIAKIQASKTFDSAYAMQRQIFLSLASLAFYDKGQEKDLEKIWHSILTTVVPDIAHTCDAHAYVSFEHLTSYGSRYYGYLWSRVFALDIFEVIKKEGLLNPAAGKRYVNAILSHGASKNPNDLLVAYLGRQPTQDAFLADQGLL